MTEAGPLDELLAHLKGLQNASNDERLNTALVEQSRFPLRDTDVKPSHIVELAQLTLTLLRTSQHDLEPLVRFLSDAIELVSFDDLRTSIPVEVVTEGLSSAVPAIQGLSLSYLKTAAQSPSGAASVANDAALVRGLIKVFLTSKSTDIGGTKALETILLLLSVDNPEEVTTVSNNGAVGQTSGQGLLWRRIFHDDNIYGLFFQFTSDQDAGHDLSRSDITTAQARLLDFVSGIAKMRWDAIHDSKRPYIQASSSSPFRGNVRERSLLKYATLTMVDRTDPLMTNILVNFLTTLLQLKSPAGCSGISSIPATSSPSLEFLVASGLHQRALDYYLRSEELDKFELQFLAGAQIRYLCAYTDLYPEHFMQEPDLPRRIIKLLEHNLHISGARWAHGLSPVQDLNVLAHLPASALVGASRSTENPVLLLPTNPANADAFETLGKIFHGPSANISVIDEGLVAGSEPFSRGSQAVSARVLFYQYHDKHPEFWSNVAAAMNVLAMPRAASAAITLVRSIVTAVWARLPDHTPNSSGPLSLLTEQDISELCGGNVSGTGMAEVLNAGESAVQSLLMPVKTVGGDAEAARLAWRIGREKHDILVLMSDLMKKGVGKNEVPKQLWQNIAGRIQERIRLDVGGGYTTQTNLVSTIGG